MSAYISLNPNFAANYHLQSDSPCRNAGDPEFVPDPGVKDTDGEPRVMGSRVDMGVDEYAENIRPIADAGQDQSMSDMPPQVTLDGSGSSDPTGDPLSYHWSQTFGPEVEIDDANSAITAFSPAEYGGYIFELVVNDGFLDSFADSVNIVVGSGHIPVADAGLPRYAAADPVELDGTGSYDPDNSGPLSYQWQQISGPNLTIVGADTPTPTISGFTPTGSIQRCEFELIVSDGQYESLPGTVFVIIVHNRYSESSFRLETDTFDPERPTIIHFGRGGSWDGGPDWNSRANILSDITDTRRDFFRDGDNLIVYLSSVAPDYKQPIQLSGVCGGTIAAIEVAGYMNRTYQDRRYAVNHVAFFASNASMSLISRFLASRVDREQCWVDSYLDESQHFLPCLNVKLPASIGHGGGRGWYKNSLTYSDLNQFTSPVAGPGVIGGAYWSVIGPGRNLQVALTPYTETYRFRWDGSTTSGYMDFYDEFLYPGRLPEPVTLIDPLAAGTTDPNAPVVFTCEESENAVGYELLFGSDPYRVAHYDVISDTPEPPNEVITTLPFESGYWTIRARDQYGTTIYADPSYIDNSMLSRAVKNLNTAKWYGSIQHAINDANSGDEIVAKAGVYYETIDFGGKNVTLRSTAPDDRDTIAATVIKGNGRQPVMSFCKAEDAACLISGFTITDGNQGIYCYGGCPTVTNCKIVGNAAAGIEWWTSLACRYPIVANCIVAGNGGPGMDFQERGNPSIINCVISGNGENGIYARSPWMTNCTVVGNKLWGVTGVGGKVANCIIWDNAAGAIESSPVVSYSNIEGGWAGAGNIDADPCFAQAGYWADATDPNITVEPNGPNAIWVDGDYHLNSSGWRWVPETNDWDWDIVTSRCIDAGNPGCSLGDELLSVPDDPYNEWGINLRINMGAYGGTSQASMGPHGWVLLADLNNDGIVDWLDVGLYAQCWLSADYEPAGDLNRGGTVDMGDWALLGQDWPQQTIWR